MKYKNQSTRGTSDILFFAAVSAICFLLSSSVLPFLTTGIKPDLLLCLCCLLPKFLPTKSCCIFAVTLGYLSDLFINPPYHLSPVLFLCAVIITPLFYSGFKRVGTVTASVCALVGLAFAGVVRAATGLLLDGTQGLYAIIVNTVFAELMVNFAFTLLTGYILKVLCSRFGVAKNI